MAESALAPLRIEPYAEISRAESRANGNRGPLDRNAGRSSWALMSRFSHYGTRPLLRIVRTSFGAGIGGVLLIGWLNRDQDYLTPESGIGYWLGIAGASLMLLLLLYPLRKRMPRLRAIGSLTFWFRLHMALGLVGPALILFHSNFRLGSLNSNVAMLAMLIVATSGIVGRYLYVQIHLGLYGRKAQVRDILADIEIMKHALGGGLPAGDRVVEELNAFAMRATGGPRNFLGALCALPGLEIRARVIRHRLLRDVRSTVAAEAKRCGWSRRTREQRIDAIAELMGLHLAAVRKAAAFAFYERLFGLWHVLHLPLFFILVLAAAIHVVAAHLF
jgi:hypothetical protein